jgi:hypothetical protein
MKAFLFALLATTLLTATSAFAAPTINLYGPGYPPVERGREYHNGYDRDYRPDYRERDRRNDGRRYDREQNYDYNQGPNYGYEREQPVIVQPQPRRPVGVSIQIQL